MSYLHTVSIESQRHHWKRSSESIDQRRSTKKIDNRHQKKNNHELHQKANKQKDKRAMTNCMKWQHQKRKSVSEAHSKSESELQITKEASKNRQTDVFNVFLSFFIKCMQSMTMTLSKCYAYVRLHVSWSKSLLYIFSLINHIDSLCKQALSIKQLLSFMFLFSRLFVFFSLYFFVFNNHFLVAIQVLFKYSSIAILSILMINSFQHLYS